MQVHYHKNPSVTPSPDATTTRLYYAKATQAQHAWTVWTGTPTFTIPANTTGYKVNATCTVNGNWQLIGVAPHMHTLGTAFNTTATASAANTCLMTIPRWDFNWQGGYLLQQPLTLKSGDKIATQCTYNNNTASSVSFGESTGDDVLRLHDRHRGGTADVHLAHQHRRQPAQHVCAMKRVGLALALVFVGLTGVVWARARANRPLHVDYYYIPYCMSCAKVRHGLENFKEQFGARVAVRTMDCFSKEGVAAAQKYGFVTHGIVVEDRGGQMIFEEKDHGVSADDVRVIVQGELAKR